MAPETVDPMALSMFVNGDYDFLYEEGEAARIQESSAALPRNSEHFRLQDARHFVLVKRISKKSGLVVESNLWPKGAQVRSRVNWRFAVKPRNGWSPRTFVSPRTLTVEKSRRPAA